MHQYIEKYSFSIFIYLFGKLVCISSDTTNARFDLNWYVTQMQCVSPLPNTYEVPHLKHQKERLT